MIEKNLTVRIPTQLYSWHCQKPLSKKCISTLFMSCIRKGCLKTILSESPPFQNPLLSESPPVRIASCQNPLLSESPPVRIPSIASQPSDLHLFVVCYVSYKCTVTDIADMVSSDTPTMKLPGGICAYDLKLQKI